MRYGRETVDKRVARPPVARMTCRDSRQSKLGNSKLWRNASSIPVLHVFKARQVPRSPCGGFFFYLTTFSWQIRQASFVEATLLSRGEGGFEHASLFVRSGTSALQYRWLGPWRLTRLSWRLDQFGQQNDESCALSLRMPFLRPSDQGFRM